jgi:hypothetical protein
MLTACPKLRPVVQTKAQKDLAKTVSRASKPLVVAPPPPPPPKQSEGGGASAGQKRRKTLRAKAEQVCPRLPLLLMSFKRKTDPAQHDVILQKASDK